MRSTIVSVILFGILQMLDCQKTAHRLSFFDIELLQRAVENKEGNVMISPASIKSTLAMLLEGARGDTSDEIKSALRVSPVRDDFRHELRVFLKTFEIDSKSISLENANALFTSKNLKLKKDYENIVQHVYKSEIREVNFNDAKIAADTVNNWVSNKTYGHIPTIIEADQIPPSTIMMVTNALYFKAPWLHKFNNKMTYKDCFYNKGACTNISMMIIQEELNYAYVDDLRAHAVELPYADDRYSMILLVSKDRDVGYSTILRDLPNVGIPQIAKLMEPNDVVFQMPKFDIEYSDDMTEPLRKLRIKTLFSSAANLSGIFGSDGSAYVSRVQHSVHMKVDEEGTIAAAASTSAVVPLINDQVRVRLDRPFLFFIRDRISGVILFEGKIEEPTAYVEPPKGISVKPQVVQQAAKRPFESNIPPHHSTGTPHVFQQAAKQPFGSDILQNQAPGQTYPNRVVPNNTTVNQVHAIPVYYDPAVLSAPSFKPTVNQENPIRTNYDQAIFSQSGYDQTNPRPFSLNQKDVAQQAVPGKNRVQSHTHRVQTQPDSNSHTSVGHQTETTEKEPPRRLGDFFTGFNCHDCY